MNRGADQYTMVDPRHKPRNIHPGGNGERSSETRTLTPCKSQDMRAIRAGGPPIVETTLMLRVEPVPLILGMNPASRHRRSVLRLRSSVTQSGLLSPQAPNAFDARPGPRVACSLARRCAIQVMTRGVQAAETAAKGLTLRHPLRLPRNQNGGREVHGAGFWAHANVALKSRAVTQCEKYNSQKPRYTPRSR